MNSTLKYMIVADSLRRRIRSGILPPGEQLPTEPDLAVQFKVGRVTVRKALEILETEGLLRREKGRGTFVHNWDADSETRRILYIGEMHSHFYKDFYIQLLAELQDSRSKLSGYAVPPETDLAATPNGLPDLLAQNTHLICQAGIWPVVQPLLPQPVSGLTLIGLSPPGNARSTPAYHIYTNGFEAARLACTHLLDRGHRRICFVGPNWDAGTPAIPAHACPTVQFAGAQSAVHQRRGACFSEIGQWGHTPDIRRASLQTALRALEQWPDAFIVESDFRAVDLLRLAAGLGRRCPDDFSLVSLGDTPWSEATDPPITSVNLGDREMAHAAAQFCVNPVPDRPIILKVSPHLISRGTVRNADQEGIA